MKVVSFNLVYILLSAGVILAIIALPGWEFDNTTITSTIESYRELDRSALVKNPTGGLNINPWGLVVACVGMAEEDYKWIDAEAINPAWVGAESLSIIQDWYPDSEERRIYCTERSLPYGYSYEAVQ